LIGDEIRGCWQEADRPIGTVLMPHDTTPAHKLDFVPVGDTPLTAEAAAARSSAPGAGSPEPELPIQASRTTVPANDVRFGLWDE
jgi:hypothetical protein